MDQDRLKQTAEVLQGELRKYAAVDGGVAALGKALASYITQALSGQLQQPLTWQEIPGDRTFSETDLQKYSDLETAYSNFKFAATGGEPDWVRQFRERRGH